MPDLVRLASLRVAADLDASAYKAGAQAKADADGQMVASGKALGDQIEVTQRKLVAGAGAFEQWKRSNIDGYSASQGMARGLDTLQRGLEQNRITAEQAAQGIVGLSSRYGLAVTAADLASRGLTNLAAVAAAQPGLFAPAAAAAEKLAESHGHVGSSASKMREGLVLVHEFLSGNYRRAVGSGTIELQNFAGAQNLATFATNPFVLGIGAAVAVMAAAALATIRYRGEISQMELALRTTAQGSGQTVDSLLRIADATSRTSDVTRNEGRQIVAGIAQIGELGSKSFALVAAHAQAFGKIMGEDAVKGGEDLAKALADPIKGLGELDAKLHFLDPEFRQHIRDLVESGNAEQARQEILVRAGPKLDELNRHIADNTYFWQRWGKAIADGYDSLSRIGTEPTLDERLARLTAQLQREAEAANRPARTAADVPTTGQILAVPGALGSSQFGAGLPGPQDAEAVSTLSSKLNELDRADMELGVTLRDQAAAAAEVGLANSGLLLQADEMARKTLGQQAEINKLVQENNKYAEALTVLAQQGDFTSASVQRLTAAIEENQRKLAAIKTPEQEFIDRMKEQKAGIDLQIQGFGKSSAEQERLKLVEEARKLGLKDETGAIQKNVQAVIDSVFVEGKRLDALTAQKPVLDSHVAELNKATEAMKAFDDKTGLRELLPGAAMLKDYGDKVTDLRTKIVTITGDMQHFTGSAAEHTKITLDLAKAKDELARAEGAAGAVQQISADLDQKAHDSAFRRVEELEAEAKAIAGGAQSLALFNEAKKEAQIRTEVYAAVLDEEKKRLGDVAAAQDAATAAANRAVAAQAQIFSIEQQTQNADKVEKSWDRAFTDMARRLDSTVVRSLTDALDTKKVTDWGATFSNVLHQLEAELINIALIRPAIGSVFSGLGFSQAATALGVGGAGGGSGTAASGGAGSLFNLPFGSAFNASGAGGGIGSFLFGGVTGNPETGLGEITSGAVPGFNGGFLGGTTTINPETGLAFNSGGASIGAIGTGIGGVAGLAGGIMGLAGGNHNTIGMIGDVGQIAGGGMALASLLPGLAALGPYGLAIAAVAAIVTSLFGNKKPHNISALNINSVGAGGDLSPLAVGNDNGTAANTDFVQSLLTQGAQPFLKSLSTQYGADFSGVNIGAYSHQTEGKDDLTAGFTGPVPGQSYALDPKNISGSLNDALTHLGLAMLQTATKVKDANVAEAARNISLDDTTQNIQNYLKFAGDFSESVKALSGGGGFDLSKSITGAAQQNASTLFGQIQQFLDTTTKLFPNSTVDPAWQSDQVQQAHSAIKSYVETLIGLKDPVDTSLTTMEAAVKQAHAEIDAMSSIFQLAGLSAGDAAEALAKKLKLLAANENASLDQQINAISHPEINTINQIIAATAINMRDALAAGADASKVTKLEFTQLDQAISGLTVPELQNLIATFKDLAGGAAVVAAANARLEITRFEDQKTASLKILQTQQSALQAQVSQYQNFATSLKQFAAGLDIGTLSPLSGQGQLDAARAIYQSTKAAALSGDPAAMAQLQAVETQYLTLERAFESNAQVYTAVFNEVKSTANAAASYSQQQISLAEQGNSLLQQQIDVLDAQLAALQALKGATPGTVVHVGGAGGVGGGAPGSADLVATTNGVVSKSAADAYLAANRDVLAAATLHTLGLPLDWTNEQVAAWHFANYGQSEGRSWTDSSVPHMAGGGIVRGGIPGMDSVPLVAMPGEGVVSVPGMRTLDAINSGRFSAANDNPALLAGIRAMHEDQKAGHAAIAHVMGEGLAALRSDFQSLRNELMPVVRALKRVA